MKSTSHNCQGHGLLDLSASKKEHKYFKLKNSAHPFQAEMPYLRLDEEPEVLNNGTKGIGFSSINIHSKSIIQLGFFFWPDLFPVAKHTECVDLYHI